MLRMAKESQSVEKKSSSNKLLVIIIVFLLAVIGVGAFFVLKGSSNQEEVADSGIAGYDANIILNADDLKENEQKVGYGMMNLNFDNKIVIENGKDGTCDISNKETNSHDMYVSLWLDDTQEEIYRSGIIPLGAKIEKLELKTPLEVGEYTGTLVFVQVEDGKDIGKVNVEVTLKVNS